MPTRLIDCHPHVSASQMIADLTPPPRFEAASFDSYQPDSQYPSQAAVVEELKLFAEAVSVPPRPRRRWLRQQTQREDVRGVYLDGGFGVGKTHLLASLWGAVDVPPSRKLFCTFVELTHTVGVLGFATTVDLLSTYRLICIDEFELDDPGDTVLVSTLLTRLSDAGVWLAATSNTIPGELGQGRFAADDFLREIQGLAARFDAIRIDGDDYRHRGLLQAPKPLDDSDVVTHGAGVGVTLDDFSDVSGHLANVHPSQYGAMLRDVQRAHIRNVQTISDQSVALRWVVLIDRLYDREIAVAASGVSTDQLFSEDLLAGAYRKKYLRAISRLTALSVESL